MPPSVERTPLSASDDVGVGQPAKVTASVKLTECPWARRLIGSCPFPRKLLGDWHVGVGQPASHATRPSSELSGTFDWNPPSFQSRVVGVGHPVRSVADVRGTDARRRKRDTPEGVTHAFQVSVYKVDPRVDSLARNLLSKDDCRAALRDEVLPGGP
jgi:hypothetical protein